jgi:hypothetical protein
MKTLEELKAENAAIEDDVIDEAPQAELDNETENEAVEEETDDTLDEAESDDKSDEESEIEEWAKSDEQTSHDNSDTVPVAAHAKVRAKLKAKVEERDSEIERLRLEIESIKKGVTAPQPALKKPNRDDFWEADDPDDAYLEALADWKINTRSNQQEEHRKKAELEKVQQERNKLIEKSVDSHYERAAKLSEQSGITAAAFQSADLAVKQAVESLAPGFGETIVNMLISNLGDGSEKVMYHLGVNKSALAELKDYISTDMKDGGMRAAMYLGRKSAQLNQPKKRVSQAPSPASQNNGDASTSTSEAALKRKYQEAARKDDTQARFDIRKLAKQKNINISNW